MSGRSLLILRSVETTAPRPSRPARAQPMARGVSAVNSINGTVKTTSQTPHISATKRCGSNVFASRPNAGCAGMNGQSTFPGNARK